jgi:succinate dehydrogenase / fumarate reductase, membrane anchor subunit
MSCKAILEKVGDIFILKSPVGHWRFQRLTAVVLTPLTILILLLLHKALHAPYAETVSWLSEPFTALGVIAWFAAVLYHAALGVQVVLEDYVADISLRHWAILACNLLFAALGVAASAAIVIIQLLR